MSPWDLTGLVIGWIMFGIVVFIAIILALIAIAGVVLMIVSTVQYVVAQIKGTPPPPSNIRILRPRKPKKP